MGQDEAIQEKNSCFGGRASLHQFKVITGLLHKIGDCSCSPPLMVKDTPVTIWLLNQLVS